MGQPQLPLDPFPHVPDPRSRALALGVTDGNYVYVLALTGVLHVLPDGPHLHPKILGLAQPVLYAGDLRITNGKICDVTNLSGTFQFDDAQGLLEVARALEALGFVVEPAAVRFFPTDGSTPLVLR
ncbi:MAG: hypothetical protein JNM18_07825 [Planctomycetaceae bacterium]|nr:hypothetical protein [Planctomycetaceae bacterium]